MQENERFIEAIDFYKKAVELWPTLFEALNRIADIYDTVFDNDDLALFYYK